MKAMVLSSGGIDSTTALSLAIDKYGRDNVTSLSIVYGQKHIKEIESASKIAAYYGIQHIQLDLEKIFEHSDCSLLSHSEEEIPEQSYDEQIKTTKGLKPVSTYVPFRNGLFLSAAASVALSKGCDVIYYGALCFKPISTTWLLLIPINGASILNCLPEPSQIACFIALLNSFEQSG